MGVHRTCRQANGVELTRRLWVVEHVPHGSWRRSEYVGASALAQQVWGKPLPGGAWALLAINGATNHNYDATVPLHLINDTGT